MVSNRVLSFALLSLGALWYREPQSMITASDAVVSFFAGWRRRRAYHRHLRAPPLRPKETQVEFVASDGSTGMHRRLLLRIHNGNMHDGDRVDMLSLLPNQIWYNPIQGKLREGIIKGLHNVGVFLIGWFVFMGTIGVMMRCYLCFQTLSAGNYNWRSLYNSFADRDPSTFEDSEGIALDSLGGREREDHDA